MSQLTDSLKYLRYRARHSLPRGNARRLLLTFLLVLALPVSVVVLQQVQRYRTGAALETAEVYFSPASQNLPPNSNFKVMLNAKSNQVGFVRFEFTLDPSKVNLASEVTVTSRLATVVQKTSMAEANSTGNVVVVAALSTTDRGNPLTGVVELANFNLTSVTAQANSASNLAYIDAGVQLIDMESNVLPFTTQAATLLLNASSATNTPTAASTATGTVTVTTAPTATSTTAPTATSTVTPTTQVTTTVTTTNAPTATNTVAPTNTTAPKLGDVNGDGTVNITDIGLIVDAYGTQPPSDARADLNKDGRVNIIDIGVVIDNYGL